MSCVPACGCWEVAIWRQGHSDTCTSTEIAVSLGQRAISTLDSSIVEESYVQVEKRLV